MLATNCASRHPQNRSHIGIKASRIVTVKRGIQCKCGLLCKILLAYTLNNCNIPLGLEKNSTTLHELNFGVIANTQTQWWHTYLSHESVRGMKIGLKLDALAYWLVVTGSWVWLPIFKLQPLGVPWEKVLDLWNPFWGCTDKKQHIPACEHLNQQGPNTLFGWCPGLGSGVGNCSRSSWWWRMIGFAILITRFCLQHTFVLPWCYGTRLSKCWGPWSNRT